MASDFRAGGRLSAPETWRLFHALANETGMASVIEACAGSDRPASDVVRETVVSCVEGWAGDDLARRGMSPRAWVDGMCDACAYAGVDDDATRAFFEAACESALRAMSARDA